MADEDDHLITVDIPKPRVCAKISVAARKKKELKLVSQKTLRKPSEVSLRKYSLACKKPLPVDMFEREDLYLAYKMYANNQNRENSKRSLAIPVHDKYKIISTDLRMRLHIDYPAENVKTVTDIDEGYYHNVNERQFSNNKHLFKTLKFLFSKQLRMQQEIGCRKDTILNIITSHKKEQEVYDISCRKCIEQAKYFNDFISEDYKKSMVFLEKCEELRIKLDAKITGLQNVASEEFTIVSRLIGLEYLYGLQQKYGRFLYYLSPPSWRSRNRKFAQSIEIEAKGFDFGTSSEEDTFYVIFEKMQRVCSSGLIKPVLYFTHPNNLMDIFETIEKHELHHFIHVTRMAPHTKTLKNGIRHIKDLISHESSAVASTIRGFQRQLQFCEERSALLEAKFLKIITGMFYESVGTPEVLKLLLHLEFCYEKVFNEKPMNVDIVTIAKALENMYMEYSKLLDEVHSGKMKQAVIQCLKSERLKIKRAKVAARELRLFERLQQALLRAHTPISKNSSVAQVVHRPSIRKRKSKPKLKFNKVIQTELTEAEKEYLILFTDWIENEDPAHYLQSLSITE